MAQARAAAASAQVATCVPTKGKCKASSRLKPWSNIRVPEPSIRSSRAVTSTLPLRHGRRLESEGDPARVEVDSTQDLGVGIVGVDHHHAPRHDLATTAWPWPGAFAAALRREPERRGDIGHDRGVKGDPVKATLRKGLAGDLEDASLAAALDHLGQQGRQTGRARRECPGLDDRVACEL